ncbi:hypothetical protein EYC80_006289 [Monilinia laxa]|uniref:Transcription factor TFIIB cyclin-like domain-containing protein n=1 Tax=Monilinia laxa TaxID=61186 RepID=A0A5N6KIB4_MONLA|nr:hypothetical protein EYC80_006289 [Monilinia laxa]
MELDPFIDHPEIERHWGDDLSTLHSISSQNQYIASVDDPLDEPSLPDSQNIHNKKTTRSPLSIHPSEKEDSGLQLKYQLTICGGWRIINDFCSTGNLPNHVADKAIGLLEVLSEAKDEWFCPHGTVGKLQEILIACCIYIACQQYDIPRTFKEIRVLTGTSKSEYKEAIGQAFKFLQDFISITKCSCLKNFRIPPEGCCQVCHEISKRSSPDANSESLKPCIKCSGLYHMSCAMRTSAVINSPNPGDLVCRRYVPCTIHPHIEQGSSRSTEKDLSVAPDNVHAEARKGTKGTSTYSSPNISYTTFDTAQGNVGPDTMKSPAVKQLK